MAISVARKMAGNQDAEPLEVLKLRSLPWLDQLRVQADRADAFSLYRQAIVKLVEVQEMFERLKEIRKAMEDLGDEQAETVRGYQERLEIEAAEMSGTK